MCIVIIPEHRRDRLIKGGIPCVADRESKTYLVVVKR